MITIVTVSADSPVDVDVDAIFQRQSEADGVVMEILLPLIVITEDRTVRSHDEPADVFQDFT